MGTLLSGYSSISCSQHTPAKTEPFLMTPRLRVVTMASFGPNPTNTHSKTLEGDIPVFILIRITPITSRSIESKLKMPRFSSIGTFISRKSFESSSADTRLLSYKVKSQLNHQYV